MNQLELSWAAGFFDGEGCTTQCRWTPTVSVSQNDRRVLDRFRKAVEVGKVRGPYFRIRNGKEVQRFIFQASGATAVSVLKALWPYLDEVKQEQAVKVFHGCVRFYSHSPKVRYRQEFLEWAA